MAVTLYTTTEPAGGSIPASGGTVDFVQTGLTAGRGLLLFVYGRWTGVSIDFTAASFVGGESFTPLGTTRDWQSRAFCCPSMGSGGSRTIRVTSVGTPGAGYDMGITCMEVIGHDVNNMCPTVANAGPTSNITITTAYANSAVVVDCVGGTVDGGSSTSPIDFTLWDTSNYYDRIRFFYANDVGAAGLKNQAITGIGSPYNVVVEVKQGSTQSQAPRSRLLSNFSRS